MAIFNMSGGGNDSFNKLTIKNLDWTVSMAPSGILNNVTIPAGKELVGINIRVLDTDSIANDDSTLTLFTITILKQNDVISTSVLDYKFEKINHIRVSNVNLKDGTFILYYNSGGGSWPSLISLFLK